MVIVRGVVINRFRATFTAARAPVVGAFALTDRRELRGAHDFTSGARADP